MIWNRPTNGRCSSFRCRWSAGFPDVGDDAAVLGVEAGTMRETSSWLWFSGLTMAYLWKTHGFPKMISKSWPWKNICVLMNFNSLEDVFWKKNLLRRWLQGYSRRNSCTRMGGHLNSCWLFRPLKAPTMRHEQKMGVSGNSVGENDGDPLELAPFHLGFALWEPPKNLNIVDFPFGKSKIFGKSRSVTGRRGIIFIEPQTSLKGSLHKRMCRSYTCGPCR